MADIKINIDGVINASAMAKTAKSMVESTRTGIDFTRWRLDTEIQKRNEIESRLNNLQNKVIQIEKDIYKIYSTANRSADQYMAAERGIVVMSREIFSMQTTKKSGLANSE